MTLSRAGAGAGSDPPLSLLLTRETAVGVAAAEVLRPGACFAITHMALPLPPIIPSLDQIGLASLTIPWVVVRAGAGGRSFTAWGLQTFGLTAAGEALGVPAGRRLPYIFSGTVGGDGFELEAGPCHFELTGFALPVARIRLAGRLDPAGALRPGAALLVRSAPLDPLGWMTGRAMGLADWRGSLGWLRSASARRSWWRLAGAGRSFLAALTRMARARVWRSWELLDGQGRLSGLGTYRLTPLDPGSPGELPRVRHIGYRRRRRLIEVELRAVRHPDALGLLAIDGPTGLPLVRTAGAVRVAMRGDRARLTLKLPERRDDPFTIVVLSGLHELGQRLVEWP